MKRIKCSKLSVLLSILLVFQSFGSLAFASGSGLDSKVNEISTQISPGVTFSDQTFAGSNVNQAVKILNVNLNDPFTFLEVGVPNPLTATGTVSKQALQNHREGHFVVGATNAGFFDTVGKMPINLIVKDNKLVNIGVSGLGKNNPVNAPIAFGINQYGKAVIDQYSFRFDARIGDVSQQITKFNTTRTDNSVVLYTQPQQTTGTNEWGTEIVVSNVSPSPQDLYVGQYMTGTVSKVVRFGEGGNSVIPANGFVISAHGQEWLEKLKNVKEGDSVDLQLNLGDVWQNAKYMVGTGPSLVKNGQVSISMDEAQSFAKGRHPRTAIATNQAGDKVFLVTIDGRQSGYSNGVSLRDLANYLISLGAYQAINLDGGGSTAMVVRQLGSYQPTLVNSPSDGRERAISTTIQVVSTAPTSEAKTIKLTKPNGKILKGTRIQVTKEYALDQYLNPVNLNPSDITLAIEGNVGRAEGMIFIAEQAGQGKVIAKYNNAIGEVPVTVVDSFDRIEIQPKSIVIGTNETTKLTANAISSGTTLLYDRSLIKWSVEGNIGTITPDGTFTAGTEKAAGNIVASYENMKTSIPVKVGSDPVVIDGFETIANWAADDSKANAAVQLATDKVKDGKAAVKLSYDFTTEDEGIKVAYAVAKTSIEMKGQPKELGLWVNGDGAGHWLRAHIIDGTGKKHTINFTEEGELNWTGWKYVRAQVPADLPLPLKFDRIYVAEAVKEKQNKGAIYLDRLQSAYVSNHAAPVDNGGAGTAGPDSSSGIKSSFKDISGSHWAFKSVAFLSDRGVIKGYEDGTFRPNEKITRAMAAAMITRELKLTASQDKPLSFADVKNTHYAYNAIKAVSDNGIINGKPGGKFAPDQPLTRAEMAVILNRAYKLQGENGKTFTDVSANHWAAKEIGILAASKITGGYEDGSFKPSKATTRAEFSSFMERVIQKPAN